MGTMFNSQLEEKFTVQPSLVPFPVPDAEQLEQVEGEKCWEKILLVEDEDAIRDVARKILEMRGYTVFCAQNASEGLRIFEQQDGTIELVLADVAMPGMDGRELVHLLTQRAPGLKAIFISGYESEQVCAGFQGPNIGCLRKPFTLHELARKVREVIDGEPYPEEEVRVN
jgi:CheY-like chemotaxis protein